MEVMPHEEPLENYTGQVKIRKPQADSYAVDLGDTGHNRRSTNEADFLKAFRGKAKYKTIDEMTKNEPLLASVLFAIKKLIKQVDWEIKPASESEIDKTNAEFLRGALFEDMSQSWDEFLEECLTFPQYGFSVHEIVYKTRLGMDRHKPSMRSRFNDGKIGWRKLPIRAQNTIERWTYDPDTKEISGLIQFNQYGDNFETNRVFIPVEKLLLFRHGGYKDNPEGESVFRYSYIPWYMKKNLQTYEAIGGERNLAGYPILHVPSEIMMDSASDEEKASFTAAKDLVTNLRRDSQEGVVLPSDRDESGNLIWQLSSFNTQGKPMDLEPALQRYSREMLMPLMADFILLGHESVGSFALASSKTQMFSIVISNFMNEVSEVFNRHAFPRLLKMNKMDVSGGFPRLEHGDIESENIEALATMVREFTGAGIDLSDAENNIRTRARLPKRTTGDEMVKPAAVLIPKAGDNKNDSGSTNKPNN